MTKLLSTAAFIGITALSASAFPALGQTVSGPVSGEETAGPGGCHFFYVAGGDANGYWVSTQEIDYVSDLNIISWSVLLNGTIAFEISPRPATDSFGNPLLCNPASGSHVSHIRRPGTLAP